MVTQILFFVFILSGIFAGWCAAEALIILFSKNPDKQQKFKNKIIETIVCLVVFFGMQYMYNDLKISNASKQQVKVQENNPSAINKRSIEITQDTNPFNEPPVPIRNIQAEQQKYLGKIVVIGPIKVLDNNIENAQFRVRTSKGIKKFDYDKDVDMNISYKNTSDYATWRDLSTDNYPVIYVKGKIVPVQYSNSMGMVATEIKIISWSE